jgi:hypothetical protein
MHVGRTGARQPDAKVLALIAALIVAAGGCGAEEKRPAAPDEGTREIMAEIYAAMKVALPATADMARFSAPEERPRIQQALDRLAAGADLMEGHTRPKDSPWRARSPATPATFSAPTTTARTPEPPSCCSRSRKIASRVTRACPQTTRASPTASSNRRPWRSWRPSRAPVC